MHHHLQIVSLILASPVTIVTVLNKGVDDNYMSYLQLRIPSLVSESLAAVVTV